MSAVRVRPARTAKAPWNEAHDDWLWAHHALRRFRARAIRWIERAARVPAGLVWPAPRLAKALFAEITTDRYSMQLDGEAYKPSVAELELLELLGQKSPAALFGSFHGGLNHDRRLLTRGHRLYVVDSKDEHSFAWGVACLAMRALSGDYRRLLRTLAVPVSIDGRLTITSDEQTRVAKLVSHLIADELERMWNDAKETV